MLIVAVGIAAYAYYLNYTLIAVSKLPGADLQATPWSPSPNAAAGRSFDLGYATLDLPTDISGDLHREETSIFVRVGSAENQPQITFCPPVSDNEPDVAHLVEQARTLGVDCDTFFGLKKRVLATMPFTLPEALIWGRSKAAGQAALLTLKTLTFPADSEVRFFENQSLGMFIFARNDVGTIDLYDKRAGVSQAVLVQGSSKDLLRIADALAASYQIVGSPKASTDFEQLLMGRNLPRLSLPNPEQEGASRSEAERLEEVANEIRRRRESRS